MIIDENNYIRGFQALQRCFPCNYFCKSQKSIFQEFQRLMCTVFSRISDNFTAHHRPSYFITSVDFRHSIDVFCAIIFAKVKSPFFRSSKDLCALCPVESVIMSPPTIDILISYSVLLSVSVQQPWSVKISQHKPSTHVFMPPYLGALW